MTTLTVYGGAAEIGGNKILLEDKGAKIYLDFGEEFNFGEDYFYERLQPRSVNGLEVCFEFNLLPKVLNLYSKKMLAMTELKYKKPNIDGIFISHSHVDHVGDVNFVDEDIPLYMGHGTHKILEIYRKIFRAFSKLDEDKHNKIIEFKSGDEIKVKHLKIQPIHVEHSIPGAYGFIIHTSKGAIAYTGDFRMHGPMSEFTQEFIEKARKAKPYALLIEGTRMTSEDYHNYTEKEVSTEVNKIISESKGTVFGYFSSTNVDRFMSFYNAAVKNNRVFVIDTRVAYIIDNLRDKIPRLPDVMKDKNIRVYYRMSKSCKYCEKDYPILERPYMPRMITAEEISKKPKKFIMHLGFNRLIELVYIQPKKADFIYSLSEIFLEGEDKKEEKQVWENWMKHFGIKFHKAHSSGHACKEDLIHVIKTIAPKVLIPVHTQHPEEFKKYHKNVVLVEKGKTVKL